jgi:hypothetical protein
MLSHPPHCFTTIAVDVVLEDWISRSVWSFFPFHISLQVVVHVVQRKFGCIL